MNKLSKILLPFTLVIASPLLLAETALVASASGSDNKQSTEATVNKPVINEQPLPELAANEQQQSEQMTAAPEQIDIAKVNAKGSEAVKTEVIAEVKVEKNAEPNAPLPDAALPDAQALLEFIDSLRGYQDQSFTFDLSNISFKDNEQKHRNKLAVKVLSDASLVEFTAPARSKGRKILKQAQNMWIRFPGTRNVLRISPAQRLLGEASNGDVTGTNFSEDYSASYEGTEMLDDKSVIKLKLDAKHDKTTYKQVMFFLDSENQLPIRSDFYARSGKLAKQAYYTKFKEFNGDLKLYRMKLVDPIIAGSYTWMMFDNYQKQDLDAAIFHKDALTR